MCVDKLYTLRAKQQGKGKAAQLRAASGRLVTDIEVNSTHRGAVEIFHLCRNLHPHDVLFAECIRTFKSINVDGRAWMYRLEAFAISEKMKSFNLYTFVPERLCKCHGPIHRQSCPLSPVLYNERRWPGSDGWISADDRQFLDSLRPQPKGWTDAWGRTHH